MAIAIRGGAPVVSATASNPVTATLTGTQQPQTDDVLLIIHGNDFYDLTNMATPTVGGSSSGVTAVTNGAGDAGTNGAHTKAYTKIITSTGDVTVSVTETGSADEEKVLVVYVLSGVDTSTPADVASNGASAVSASTFVLPSVTTTPADDMLFAFAVTQQVLTVGGAWSAGTSDFDANFGGFISYVGMHEQLSASGATGTRTFDPVGSEAAAWAGVLVTLKTGTGAAQATDSPVLSQPWPLLAARLGGRWPRIQQAFSVPFVPPGTNASADVATATGTAPFDAAGGSISLNLISDNPVEAVGTAYDATVSTAPATNAAAGNAAGTGAANNATVKISPTPTHAAGTGTANNATVSTSGAANAQAGAATATGAAQDATTKVSPTPTNASATGTAFNATVQTGSFTNASAGNATATGTANNTTATVKPTPTTATATGVANNPTVSTGGNTNANAGVATATGTANNATVTRSANAQASVATASGSVLTASLQVLAAAEAASALAVALDADVTGGEHPARSTAAVTARRVSIGAVTDPPATSTSTVT